MLRSAHRYVGAATVLVFLATGVYLKLKASMPAEPGGETVRFLYRANHVYLLMAGLLNVAVGAYLQPAAGRRRGLQVAGSWLLMAAPAVLLVAFAVEPARATLVRPLTAIGVIMAFAGTMLHVPGRRRDPVRTPAPS